MSWPPGTSSPAGLLDALQDVAESHPALLDTDVREQLWEVVALLGAIEGPEVRPS